MDRKYACCLPNDVSGLGLLVRLLTDEPIGKNQHSLEMYTPFLFEYTYFVFDSFIYLLHMYVKYANGA